ncbi:dbp [Cnaphalocrocis medinalis granulovirus]|uniref:Dbp n=1 Tax=Cnaphalocrocis medinalis granulovirus TaxID=1750712 RepID=A0A109WW65_9BBAC|nr:dbp [Cnaphalocrocis medinalis granulovirus]ALN42002.1 dbp [Cnaphalocrocis medinalis granulovirus]AMF83813.1 dbp [Cnaphalocrocis medinalis granulovirus]WPN08692.1 dbp [Cnaphalocrocis medinalis granulovirus]
MTSAPNVVITEMVDEGHQEEDNKSLIPKIVTMQEVELYNQTYLKRWDTLMVEKCNNKIEKDRNQYMSMLRLVGVHNKQFLDRITETKRFPVLSVLKQYLKEDEHGLCDYDQKYLQILKLEGKANSNKIKYLFGLRTIGKPKKSHFWCNINVRICKGEFGEFMAYNVTDEIHLVMCMEQIMGKYLCQVEKRQDSNLAINIDNNNILNIPKDFNDRKSFMQLFFLIDEKDNYKNVENNSVEYPVVIKQMPDVMFNRLFSIPENQKTGEFREFICMMSFYGVEETVKKISKFDNILEYNMLYQPQLFFYIDKN